MDKQLLRELESPPEGPYPDPPVVTASQELRIGELEWGNFERLCFRLARLSRDVADVREYGTRGQRDHGIDVLARRADGGYTVYQCKRYERLTAAIIRNAVSTFLEDPHWVDVPDRFVFCTSHSTTPTQLADEIRVQTRRLREHEPPISMVVWDKAELTAQLKENPDLVGDFFGPAAFEVCFAGRNVRTDVPVLAAALESVLDSRAVSVPPRVVSLDWAATDVKSDLGKLKDTNRPAFDGITGLGTPPNPEMIEVTVRHPPPWLAEADGFVWDVLARVAQKAGAWAAAASAWKAAADRQGRDDQLRSLIAGSVAAVIGNDDERERAFLTEAAELAPDHPRVLLADISDALPGQEQLEALERLRPNHPEDRALIAGRMCLACMMVGDIDRAREHAGVVEENSPGSSMTRSLLICLTVQAGRMGVLHGTPLSTPELRTASEAALEARDTLIAERRWSEAGRMLMLAADAVAVLGERDEASKLLARAREEELATDDDVIVLAECSMGRAMDAGLTLRFIRNADQTNPHVRLVRAEALEDIGTLLQREEALRTFEDLVHEDGDVASIAAFYRLSCTIGDRPARWHETSFEYLMNNGHEKAAITVRVHHLTQVHRDYEEADKILAPYLDHTWAKAGRVRLALTWRDPDVLKQAANDLLSVGPIQTYRYDAGRAFVLAQDDQRAREIFIGIATDLAAPPALRADAYDQLLKIAFSVADWEQAKRWHEEWVKVRPGDERHNVYTPVIANRLRLLRETERGGG